MKTAYAAAIVTLLALGLVNAAQGPWDQCKIYNFSYNLYEWTLISLIRLS